MPASDDLSQATSLRHKHGESRTRPTTPSPQHECPAQMRLCVPGRPTFMPEAPLIGYALTGNDGSKATPSNYGQDFWFSP